MATIREEIINVLVPKESKLGNSNASVLENVDLWYVRDNELIQIYPFLTGKEYSGLFYNVDAKNFIKWDVDIDGFVILNESLYGAVYYSENFEGGVLPADWTLVNGGENNWVVGTAAASTGTYGLYISNDAGVSNVYSSVGAALDVSHAYVDIDLPSAATNFLRLVIDWRCEGEVGFDYAQIFDAPTSVTPVANAEVSATYLIGSSEYNNQSIFTTEALDLPIGEAGTTRRFIFSWRNDNTVENQPPMAIDNIKIIYQ